MFEKICFFEENFLRIPPLQNDDEILIGIPPLQKPKKCLKGGVSLVNPADIRTETEPKIPIRNRKTEILSETIRNVHL